MTSHQTGVVQVQQCRVEERAALEDGIGNAIYRVEGLGMIHNDTSSLSE